jgi:hypothetical protein
MVSRHWQPIPPELQPGAEYPKMITPHPSWVRSLPTPVFWIQDFDAKNVFRQPGTDEFMLVVGNKAEEILTTSPRATAHPYSLADFDPKVLKERAEYARKREDFLKELDRLIVKAEGAGIGKADIRDALEAALRQLSVRASLS